MDVAYVKSTKSSDHYNFHFCESLDKFMDLVASHWNLNQSKFNIFSDSTPYTESSWAELAEQTFPVSVILRVDILGFSDWTMKRIIELYGITEIPTVENLFEPKEAPSLESETDIVVQELLRRIKCVKQDGATESTMREFISPVLIAAVNMCNTIDLEFRAEYPIKGWTGKGPVDYDFLYKRFHICVAEAKKGQIAEAIPQNFGQLICSRDEFESITTKKRKRDPIPDTDSVALKSVGIVTSGENWMFTQLFYEEDMWKMVKSEIMSIPLSRFVGFEMLTDFVKPLLKTLYSILCSQMVAVDDYRDSKKRRRSAVGTTAEPLIPPLEGMQ